MKLNKLRPIAETIAKSSLLKRVGSDLAVRVLPEEVENMVGPSIFLFRPKIDGLWYLFNYSNAESGMKKVFSENLSTGDIFFDIGAYIGYYTVLSRNLVGESGKVVAFEPDPKSYELLRKNITLNGYKNVIAENVALSDDEGSLKLFIGKCAADSSSLFLAREVNEKEYVMVKTMTFDKYCEIYGVTPNLIKIDAEGAEYKVLNGMKKVIDHYKPKLLIELHPRHLEKQGISLHTFFVFLKQKRYETFLVEEEIKSVPIDELVKLCQKRRKNKYGTLINQTIFCNK